MFGSYLKAARLRANVTVPDAAIALGVGQDAIYRFERDANSPSMETLDKMAAAYGVLAGDLLPNSGGDFALSETLQPLAAAMIGLDADETRELVLTLSSQARLIRNAIARRSSDQRHSTIASVSTYNPRPTNSVNPGKTDGEAGEVYMVGAGTVKPANAQSDHAAGEANSKAFTSTKERKRR